MRDSQRHKKKPKALVVSALGFIFLVRKWRQSRRLGRFLGEQDIEVAAFVVLRGITHLREHTAHSHLETLARVEPISRLKVKYMTILLVGM